MDNLLVERLKEALSSARFTEANELIDLFGQMVKQKARSAANPGEGMAALDDALRVLRDQLAVARVMRAHMLKKLNESVREEAYANRECVEQTWCADA